MIAKAVPIATQRLAAVSESPRLDAEVLLSHVLGCQRSMLLAQADSAIGAPELARFEGLVKQRADGVPTAYLTGVREFWSLDFEVSPDVLVPRPESELLVEWGLDCLGRAARERVADLGTGSGCLAIALAHERRSAEVTAIDISEPALAVARRNAQRHGVSVRFERASFAAFSPAVRFDLVVANPPYVARHDRCLEALRHEPELALVSGCDGLASIREIAAGAQRLMAAGAWLLLEHGAGQGEGVRNLLQAAGFGDVESRRDLAGLERATGGRWPV